MAGKRSILLAACDYTLAGIFGRKFERAGWDVEVVETIKEAEHKAVQMRPQILLLDSSCSIDIAKEVRRLKALPTMLRTHIVLLANHAPHEQIQQALAAGAADYLLVGHFVPVEAVEKMERLLGV